MIKSLFFSLLSLLFLLQAVSLNGQNLPLEATLLGTWNKPGLVGSNSYNNTYNEIWGLAVSGREYAVLGSTAGTHFVDVTDPTQPVEAAFVPGAAMGGQIIHRDYHNYGCYLYAVADEGQSTLQIIDVSFLPDSVSVVYDSGELLRRAHNIFIDTAQARLYCLYALGGDGIRHPMRIFDISNPVDPVYLADYGSFGGLTTNAVHDAYVDHGQAFLNCGNGLAMVDFTDPFNPQTLGILRDYVFAGYNHSGWPANDGQHYYLADETHGYPMKVLDISDPEDIMAVGTLSTPGAVMAQTIPHNQIVACNYLYVSYYYDGLQIYDISDPANPQLAYYYDTYPGAFDNNYRGAWGVYPFLPSGNVLISDMQSGLFVFAGPGDTCSEREASSLACGIVNGTDEPAPAVATLRVYPQPAREVLHLQWASSVGSEEVSIFLRDLNGRLVHTFAPRVLDQPATELSLPRLPAGLYLLEVRGANGRVTTKVVIQEG
jgi:choice-of-anchor B domain-containing protein